MNPNDPMEEIHNRTVEVLATLVPVLDTEDLGLLLWHCGVKTEEIMPVVGHAASDDTESIAAFIERITS